MSSETVDVAHPRRRSAADIIDSLNEQQRTVIRITAVKTMYLG